MTWQWGRFSAKGLRSQVQSTARLNIWDGAVRSSKTINSLVSWINFVGQAPDGNLMMLGKTERTLKRNVLDPLAEMFPGHVRYYPGAGEVRVFGRRIYTAAANDTRSEAKIRGITLLGAYGDEITLWPENVFITLLSRLSVDDARFYGTTNPDSPYHWLKKTYLDRQDQLDLQRFHFQLSDNPTLSPAYINALKSEYTGLWYKRFILGLWVQAEGAVYDLFDESRHVVTTLPAMRQFWVGVDYGTNNPSVFLLAGEGVDNRLYIIDEWRWDSSKKLQQLTDAAQSRALQVWLERHNVVPRWIWVDPSALNFRNQLYHDGVKNVAEADNNVLDGIRATASLLEYDLLKIHVSCEGLIEEMQGYAWDPVKQIAGIDQPIKRDDHGCDCARYITNGTRLVWTKWMRAAAARAARAERLAA